MAFNSKEQEIIKYGLANGKTKEQVTQAITNFRTGIVTKPKESTSNTGIDLLAPAKEALSGLATTYGGGENGIANKLKTDITEGAKAIQEGDALGSVKAGFRAAGDVAETVYAPVGAVIQATGINKVFDFIGKVSQMGGKYNPINALTDIKAVQDFVAESPHLEEDFGRAMALTLAKFDSGKIDPTTVIPRTIEQVKAGINSVKNLGTSEATTVVNNHLSSASQELKNIPLDEINKLGGTSKLFEQNRNDIVMQLRNEGFNSQADAVSKADLSGVKSFSDYESTIKSNLPSKTKAISNTIKNVASKLVPDSSEIMNRVARLKPTDATKFEKLAGQTHGEYLKDTGNTKSPDEIIKNEATKFTETLASKDAELAKLPGLYKDGSISDALQGLLEKAKSTSGENVKSPYLKQVMEWEAKHNSSGLSMEDINLVKRLYEREVKLGYNKLINGEKVAQATNIDSALRDFQNRTADSLGFENLSEINKQIQLSKFLVDKLGDQVVGQSGLNGVNLTDWVILAGGDPTAVGAFLTKKFFSSKTVQAKIAEYLNKGQAKGTVTPKTTITSENINRQVNPQGFKALPEGKKGAPQSENKVPILRGGKFEMEKATPSSSKPQKPQLPKKLEEKPLPKTVPKTTTKVKMPKSVGSLSSEKFGNINFFKGESPTGKSTGFGMAKIEGKLGGLTKEKLKSTLSSIIDKLPVKSESANRIILEDSKFRIIISKDWKGQPTKPWLMNVIIK